MVNTIGEGDHSLVRLDYSSLLKAILNELKITNPFKISKNRKQLLDLSKNKKLRKNGRR